MPVSRAHAKATAKWEAKALDKVCLRIRKDGDTTRDRIQDAATAAGESLNAYILEAVRQRMEREAH
jgi:uncharacterized protein (DUF1778 family)